MSRAGWLATLAGVALAAGCGGEDRPAPARPKPPPAIPGQGSPAALVSRTTWLHRSPGGPRLVRLNSRTEFKSARVLSVVEQRGSWVGVLASELRNGQVGWLDTRRSTRLFRVPYTLEADLSRRRLVVRRLGKPVAATKIAVGRPAAPTPPGRFAVTDKLKMGDGTGPYGCCALALTGHQPRLPQGWGGGDRLAIHATPSEETIGQAVSAGCLRATNSVMRRLIQQIPLGTPVQIRR